MKQVDELARKYSPSASINQGKWVKKEKEKSASPKENLSASRRNKFAATRAATVDSTSAAVHVPLLTISIPEEAEEESPKGGMRKNMSYFKALSDGDVQ